MEENFVEEFQEEVIETALPEDELDLEDGLHEEEELDKEFDPDEEDFDEDKYVIQGYNLESLNDILFLDDPENVELVSNFLAKYTDVGFTQEQVEFLIRAEMEDEDEEPKKPKARTAKEIQAELKESLTAEEKRNYKAVNAYLADVFEGTELAPYRKEIMSNPYLVKFANVMFTKSLGQTGSLNKTAPKRSEKPIASLGYEDAIAQVQAALGNKEEAKALAAKLSKQVSDKESFNGLCKAMGLI